MKLLFISVKQVMLLTAVLDIAIGALLLFDVFVWLAALVAVVHLVLVLAVSGINEITVRDIAILAGAIALFFESMPESFRQRLP